MKTTLKTFEQLPKSEQARLKNLAKSIVYNELNKRAKRKTNLKRCVALLALFLLLQTVFVFAFAFCGESIDIERLATAIGRAENSVKYPYGIKSINTYGNKEYARKICLNTIRNHIKRHAKHNCNKDFISCLGDRYCPTTIKSEYHLNKNWVKNVKYYYKVKQ